MFFWSAAGKADCWKAGIGSIFRRAMGLADCAALRAISTVPKSWRRRASVIAAPLLCPVMPMKRGTFGCLYC